jgi:hypothetical protein
MKKARLLIVLLVVAATTQALAWPRVRHEFRLPGIPGYVSVRCDLHMHTVFSDGFVWPTVRVDEAWREGLDAIAITEHVEYLMHQEGLKVDRNRSFELARPLARALDIVLIRGGEITRDVNIGHYNAVFLRDAEALNRKDFFKAVQAAADQGAFIVWNHPEWTPSGDVPSRWTAVQEKLLSKGQLHAIEVVNVDVYSPNAHRWCLEKKLTMVGYSDVHHPMHMEYDYPAKRRPATIVFAKARTAAAIHEALRDRRTVVHHQDQLIGEERFLRPIFEASIEVVTPRVEAIGRKPALVQIRNRSDMIYELTLSPSPDLVLPASATLHPDAVSLIPVKPKAGGKSGARDVTLRFVVGNLLIEPGKGLAGKINLRLE